MIINKIVNDKPRKSPISTSKNTTLKYVPIHDACKNFNFNFKNGFRINKVYLTASYLLTRAKYTKSLIWNKRFFKATTIMLAKHAIGKGWNKGPNHKITTKITRALNNEAI